MWKPSEFEAPAQVQDIQSHVDLQAHVDLRVPYLEKVCIKLVPEATMKLGWIKTTSARESQPLDELRDMQVPLFVPCFQ